jgi:hypothetical protein
MPTAAGSKRLQILHEVSLLVGGETEFTNPVVMREDIGERDCAAIVKIR